MGESVVAFEDCLIEFRFSGVVRFGERNFCRVDDYWRIEESDRWIISDLYVNSRVRKGKSQSDREEPNLLPTLIEQL